MKNKTSVVVGLLLMVLLWILLFPKTLEGFLGQFFASKFPEGGRTPLRVLFIEHMEMVLISSFLAIFLGFFLGLFLTTSWGKPFKGSLMKLVSLGQTFPTAAILALVIPVVGYGLEGAIVALFLYALMPIVYNVVVGIEEVSEAVVEAAKGMGMTELDIYRKVKIPLAMKTILGGIRTSTVINISAATLAAAAGAGGLGVLVVNGVRTFDMILILMGSIPVTLMAILTELSIGMLEKKRIYTQ